jgi:hypothetical protein
VFGIQECRLLGPPKGPDYGLLYLFGLWRAVHRSACRAHEAAEKAGIDRLVKEASKQTDVWAAE